MVRVRSHDEFVGIEILEEATWGTAPTWTSPLRVPFLAEELYYETETFPPSEEFAGLGAVTSIDQGRRLVRGTLRVEPAYDAKWWWLLFGQVWGAENLVTEWDIYAARGGQPINTHIWTPGPGLPQNPDREGLSMKIYKSGIDDTGFIDTITGLIVTRFTWDHPEGGRATAIFEFLGKEVVTSTASGKTLAALETNMIRFQTRDLTNAPTTSVMVGNALTSLNITGWNLVYDRKIEAEPNYLQSIDALAFPGIAGLREITLTLNSYLEQDYSNTNKPYKEYLDQDPSAAVITYTSDQVVTGAFPYAMSFQFPQIIWRDVRPNIKQAGIQGYTMVGQAILGALSRLDTPFNTHTGIPSTGTDIRVLNVCNQGDEPSTDSKFCDLPNA